MVEGPQKGIVVSIPPGLAGRLTVRRPSAPPEDYSRADHQLGADSPAVRIGGLRSLERLARHHPADRQQVVDRLCDHLRLPDREREVRQVAQRVLAGLLRQESASIDLNGAVLVDLDLSDCQIGEAKFDRAVFTGEAKFDGARFGQASFDHAHFEARASFGGTRFTGHVTFVETRFDGFGWFLGAEFAPGVWFTGARFRGPVRFGCARFAGRTIFADAEFQDAAQFVSVKFGPLVSFSNARFADVVWFGLAEFGDLVRFDGTRFEAGVWFDDASFAGDSTVFQDARFVTYTRMNGVKANAYQRSGQYEPSWPHGWLVDVDGAENGWARLVPAPVLLPDDWPFND